MTAPGRTGIWGFGREGAAALRFIRGRTPDNTVVVVDDDPARVAETAPDLEISSFAALLTCTTCFVSPGVRPTDPRRAELDRAGVQLTTGTNEFLYRAAARTVGVTGTKGKSTTATFVHALLAAEHHRAVLAGNIGEPLLDLLSAETGALRNADDLFVAELSSYQCASLVVSPRIAVVTQLYDDHLVEHGTRDAYWTAKSRIFAGGAEVLVAAPETVAKLRTVARIALAGVPTVITPPERASMPAGLPAHVADNLRVALAGASALLGRPVGRDALEFVARRYRPLPHRLVPVATVSGITWVDDALATTQESVLAALAAYPTERVALLLGGRDRGQPVDRLVAILRGRPEVQVLLLGETTERFGRELGAAGVGARRIDTVEAAVTDVAARSAAVDVCLLSPAAASYDQFRDHRAKGAAFAAAVAALAAG